MKSIVLQCVLASCCVAVGSAAQANSCADEFEAIGDPRNGMLFTAHVQVQGLQPRSAIGQLVHFATEGGYTVGSEQISANTGELSFLQTNNKPAIVIKATADSSGTVTLSTKLARTQKANPVDVQQEFCSILAMLKPGKEGEAIAATARAQSGSGRIWDAQAAKLSAEIGAEAKRALGPVAAKGNFSELLIGTGTRATAGEYDEAFAPIRAKYIGRRYRIDGQIFTITNDGAAYDMVIAYLVSPKRGLLGIREDPATHGQNFQVRCVLAGDQVKLFRTLAEGDWLRLTGTVASIQPGGMQLELCRQADNGKF